MIHRVGTPDTTVCGIVRLDGLPPMSQENIAIISDSEVRGEDFPTERLEGVDKTPCKECWESTYNVIRVFKD